MSSDDIRMNSRSARRQEEGYAKSRENLNCFDDGNLNELIDLYCYTFEKQDKFIDKSEIEYLKCFCGYFLELGIGKILVVRNESNQAVAAGFIFEDYDKTWHVPLIGVGDTRYGGTLLYYYAIDYIKAADGKRIDFNGANSPQRSYFKHSMGAKAKLYFMIKLMDSNRD